jgi:PncC family amidohydrolase
MQDDVVLRIFGLCREKGVMISVCESLTGGLVADTLIGRAGASGFFYEGVVAYSNEAKIRRLFVKEETLKKFGAVSGETAEEMANGLYVHGAEYEVNLENIEKSAKETANGLYVHGADYQVNSENIEKSAKEAANGLHIRGADYENSFKNIKRVGAAVSTTGIAGPGGGSAEKPVGLTYIGVCAGGKTYSRRFIFDGNREEIRIQAKDKALELLEEGLKGL